MVDRDPRTDFEQDPLTRTEYVTAMVHFYRGELQRSLTWRVRLDATTNWAIIATVGLLSFAFNNAQYASQVLLAGMFANLLFLLLESQRFRFFDVYRARLRMIEENFYVPLLRRDLVSPIESWADRVAGDLMHPRFHLTMRQAIRARLQRIYVHLFIAQIVGWLSLVLLQRRQAGESFLEVLEIGLVPGWVTIVLMSALALFLLYVMLFTPRVVAVPEFFAGETSVGGEDVPELDT